MGFRIRLTNFLKYNRAAYGVYYHILSTILRAIGSVLPVDNRLILFNSFAGRRFDDSPRAIFEAMKTDPRFTDYRLIWAFHNPEQFEVVGASKIRTDTLTYFVNALKSRVWITNSSVERGLNIHPSHTLYLNTWHGTPIKLMGSDIADGNSSFKSKGPARFDAFCVQGDYEAEIFKDCFQIPPDRILRSGLPRNDELVHYSQNRRDELRLKLNIPQDKTALLYCPTFREYDSADGNAVAMRPPIDLFKWSHELGNTHILLIRAHYEVTSAMEICENDFVRDVSSYPSLNELMIAADVLISDYSSVFFDWSITGKPMMHFCYDYDKYAKNRGMYFDVREWISGADNEGDLIEHIKELDFASASERTMAFRSRFVDYCGNASQLVLDWLSEALK